jgi:hypothetical protein
MHEKTAQLLSKMRRSQIKAGSASQVKRSERLQSQRKSEAAGGHAMEPE